MSNEVFEMICAMDRRGIELQLILQCAPTLARLKTSNLFILPREDEDKARFVLRHLGLLGYRLVYDRHRVVFLVFNRDMLTDYLSQPQVQSFLAGYGYRADSFGYILRTFQSRYADYISDRTSFPHEMGALLGYPLEDVTGFIDNDGQDFLYSGYWKVYDGVEEKKALFDSFDQVKDQMIMDLSAGCSISDILDRYKNMSSIKKAV